MEGRASTFERVLADFERRLLTADFIAVDTELTGVDIEGEPDSFEESAAGRLEKVCRVAERYALIQVGLTIVGRPNERGVSPVASYNLFAFPYVGPQLLGREPSFMCQASAMQFNAQHRVNFNTWINDGVPYMSREDERHWLETPKGQEDDRMDQRVGLLRLWKSLCNARLPFIVHCPLDLFFLLAAFEQRPLPRDPQELALLIRRCLPKVYDTAHLHGVVGAGRPFRRLGLTKFFEDAKQRYEEVLKQDSTIAKVEFELQGETAERYGSTAGKLDETHAHEAGFDSLVTAQLFAYLRAISPEGVRRSENRLFLYRSIEFLDLNQMAMSGEAACCMFDLTRVTLLVAELDSSDSNDAPRLISAAKAEYKWMDSDNKYLLVVLRASGGAAVRKAKEVAERVQGVVKWMPFEEWQTTQALNRPRVQSLEDDTVEIRRGCSPGVADTTSVCDSSTISVCNRNRWWLGWLAVSTGGFFLGWLAASAQHLWTIRPRKGAM